MHRRTKRRLIVLAAVAGVVVLAGLGGTTLRKIQRQRLAETSLVEGMAAYEEGDYRTARAKLLTHWRIKGAQAETMTALGDSFRHVIEPNGKHLVQAKGYLEQAVILDPQNVKAREILLEVNGQLGNWQELAKVASELLEIDPTNERVARTLIDANLRRGNRDEAVAAARHLVEAQNGSIDSHLEMLRVLQQSGANAREQRAYLDETVAPKHAGTTSLAVLRATVEYDAAQPRRAAEILLEAGAAGPTDGRGARMLLDSLELIASTAGEPALFDQSQAWLAEWIERDDLTPHLVGLAAGRAWRLGDPERAVDLAVRATSLEPENEAVFAWGLLGAMEVRLEGDPTATRLRAAFDAAVEEDHEDRAERWLELVEAAARLARGESAADEPLLPPAAGISNRLGPDAVAAYFDALDDAARNNTRDAIERLRGLGQQPSWRRARFALARVLVVERRSLDAARLFAREMELTSLPGGAELFGESLAGSVEAGGQAASSAARAIDDLLIEYPDNPTVLAAAGRRALAAGDVDGARDVARRLARSEAALASISAIRFAAQLESADPELAREVVDRVASTARGPQQVAAAAAGLATIGQAARARALIEERAQADQGANAFAWSLARVQLANGMDDEESVRTLEAVSAANADDRRVQIEILQGSTIWRDLDQTGNVVARLRAAQGEQGLEWRIYEARRLLARDDSVQSASDAASILEPVLVSERGKRDTRAMLIAADAFARADSPESELRALAAAADGNDPLLALPRLIDRLQRAGQSTRAAERLRQFVQMGDIPPQSRRQRLQLLKVQGMHDQAARDTEALKREGYVHYVLLAGLDARPPGSDVPLTEGEEAALEADLPPEAQVDAARLLARVGRVDEGLARLESLPEAWDGGSRAVVIGRYLDEVGRDEAAIESLVRHAQANDDPDAWMEAARLLVGRMRIDEAAQVLDQAATRLPGNQAIAAFRASLDPSSGTSNFQRMASFAAAAADRQDAGEGMVALGGIAKRYLAGEIDARRAAAELEEMTARRATFYPLWPLLVAAYQELGQTESAARAAQRSLDALPGDFRVARDAAQLLLSLRRYNEALGAAQRWQDLATTEPERTQAQLALGVAEFWQRNPQRAIGLLQPHADLMRANPAEHAAALEALAEALVVSDRMAQAESLLMPLAQSDAAWASFAVSIASLAPASTENTARATRWLEALTPVLSQDPSGAVYLASSWMALFDRTGEAAYADRVVELARVAASAGASSWQLQAVLATALEGQGEYSAAVAAYERALSEAGSDVPPLLNNAAWLLTTELGEHERGAALARRAVAASDKPGFGSGDRAVFHHTLGAALLGAGDAQAALSAFDAGLRLSETPSLRLGRVEALLALNRRTEASQAFSRIRPTEQWSESQKSRYEALRSVLGSG